MVKMEVSSIDKWTGAVLAFLAGYGFIVRLGSKCRDIDRELQEHKVDLQNYKSSVDKELEKKRDIAECALSSKACLEKVELRLKYGQEHFIRLEKQLNDQYVSMERMIDSRLTLINDSRIQRDKEIMDMITKLIEEIRSDKK